MGRSAGKPCAIHRHARNGGTVYQVSVSDDATGEHVATAHCKREVDAKRVADEFVAAPDMAAALEASDRALARASNGPIVDALDAISEARGLIRAALSKAGVA